MPRLTAAAVQQQYVPPTHETLDTTSGMTYYTRSTIPAAYYAEVAPSSHQAMAAYDEYAVGTAPLATPDAGSSRGPVGGPVGSASLPAQHRPSPAAWNQNDDQMLLAARQSGQNWTQIQQTYFPNKTPNACRKRHERLMERRGAEDWDTRKMEQIAKEYMSMRREIWQPLAQRTGQKWHVVEQKCMSNGLKNLQSHARSYSRKQRNGQQEIAGPGYDDDSAVSGIGLTPDDDDLEAGADGGYNSVEVSPSTASSGSGSGSGGRGAATGGVASLHHQQQDQYDGLPAMHASGSFQGYSSSHHHPHPHHHPQPYGHGYTSSVSSTGTAAYVAAPAVGGQASTSQPDGPYAGGHRQSSLDMEISAIIHRPSGGGRRGA